MGNVEVQQENDYADVDNQPVELAEELKVTIKEPFMLGLCFGLGLGMALVFYGLVALIMAKVILTELL